MTYLLALLTTIILANSNAKVSLGVDVLFESRMHLITGKRVGLVTNISAVDSNLVPTYQRFIESKSFTVTQLYTPEHGLYAALANGRSDRRGIEPLTKIPIEGLFGRHQEPSPASLKRVDVIVFDLQDIGSRTYTYITTLGFVMKAAARARIPVIVLDRPNPLGGLKFEGPVREKRYQSLIGWAPLPVTHGMTIGEIARFYNEEMGINCDLTVVPMKGWRRHMVFEDTGLVWVPTSPGIPHTLNAHLYVATGMLGGASTNLNEGAGNSMPFELIGAPWIDERTLEREMNRVGLPGVRFRAIVWRPNRGQFAGRLVRGVQLILDDPRTFMPLRTALAMLVTIKRLHPKELKIRDPKRFARVWGNDEVLKAVMRGDSVESIESSWLKGLQEFAVRRARYLLYD